MRSALTLFAVAAIALHLAACAEPPPRHQPQGFIIVSSDGMPPCAALFDISTLEDEDRDIVFRRVADQIDASVYRSDFPLLHQIGLFRPHPCSQFELEYDIANFAHEVLGIDEPNIIDHTEEHTLIIENYENLSVDYKLDAIVEIGNTGGYCIINKEYDPSYEYMIATLAAIKLIIDLGFPIIDISQANNEIEYVFYIPCNQQVESYVDYIESNEILTRRTSIAP